MKHPAARLGRRYDRSVDQQTRNAHSPLRSEPPRNLIATPLREHAPGKIETDRRRIPRAEALDQRFEAALVLDRGERAGRLADIDDMLNPFETMRECAVHDRDQEAS